MNALVMIWQDNVPTITGPQVAMWLGIIGGLVLVVKFGQFLEAMRKDIQSNERSNARIATELREGFNRVDAALTRFSDAMTGLSSLVTALSVQVAQHERVLNPRHE